MNTTIIKNFGVICLTALLAVLSFDVAAQGQGGYPKAADDYVNDFAGVLNKPDSEAIHKMFKELENKTGIEAVVVTISSINKSPGSPFTNGISLSEPSYLYASLPASHACVPERTGGAGLFLLRRAY